MSTSRIERWREAAEIPEEHEEDFDKIHEKFIEAEDELIWALYTTLDISQSEALEMADPFIEMSQSTASRIIRDEAERVLVDGPVSLGSTEDVTDFESEEAIAKRREVLAEAVVDVRAISQIESERQAPSWAVERHPELAGEK
jgi:hypothetical protein